MAETGESANEVGQRRKHTRLRNMSHHHDLQGGAEKHGEPEDGWPFSFDQGLGKCRLAERLHHHVKSRGERLHLSFVERAAHHHPSASHENGAVRQQHKAGWDAVETFARCETHLPGEGIESKPLLGGKRVLGEHAPGGKSDRPGHHDNGQGESSGEIRKHSGHPRRIIVEACARGPKGAVPLKMRAHLEEEKLMRVSRCWSFAAALALVGATLPPPVQAAQPVRAKNGMVSSQSFIASQVGADVLWDGGNAVDAAIATAFALAVVHPTAGNIGGGGFLISRSASGSAITYDFREIAPALAHPEMFLKGGKYDVDLHHNSHVAVGIPGTVAGLFMAWEDRGSQKIPWRRLVEPAVVLAREGFIVTDGLARSLKGVLPRMQKYPASVAQFSRAGMPYEMGDILRQPDLAKTLERIAEQGPRGFYSGETARLIANEMKSNGGLITEADLKSYTAKKREPLMGKYRGYDVISMPPISSGGTALIQMLNVLEGYELAKDGPRSATTIHRISEAMRRAFANRARYLGDPEFNKGMPIANLISKEYALGLRKTIREDRASVSAPTSFEWPAESDETTHLSVVDRDQNAVSLTYTLEDGYGSKIVVPGGGFLLNNEMGDFNAGPGLTDVNGLVGTEPNLAQPGKRMLSSMTPAILAKDNDLFMVIGSPGGRTIINTVLLAILNVVDFGMNIQDAIDFPRFHHQWLPDRIQYEKNGISPDTLALLKLKGHTVFESPGQQGFAAGIVWNKAEKLIEGAADRRVLDGAAIGR